MATKREQDAAYVAGRAITSVQWPDHLADELKGPAVEHCPFGADQPELRAAWLRGLQDALRSPAGDPATILRQIDDELEVASDAG